MKKHQPTDSRPIAVILVAGYFFLLAIWNMVRLGENIFFWNTLKSYGAHPLYLVITSVLWAGGGIALMVGLWKRQFWAWIAALVGVVVHYAWYWVDRFFIQTRNQNWPFVLIASTLILLALLLLLTHKRTYGYFLKVPRN